MYCSFFNVANLRRKGHLNNIVEDSLNKSDFFYLFVFKYPSSHYTVFLSLCSELFLTASSYFTFAAQFWIQVKNIHVRWWRMLHHLVWIMRRFSFFLSAHFSVFFISPPVWFPLVQRSLYWNSNGSRVCVWPARAVIEPICRLAPVGLNPGLTALWWFKRFCCVPSTHFVSLSPLLHFMTTPLTFLLVRISSLLKLMLFGFHCVCRPSRAYLAYLVLHSVTWQIYFLPQKCPVKEVGEVLGACSLLSLTDHCMGLDALLNSSP